ncbi:hypothetical protein CGRA01v4_07129 [Colletotrichum graminicola]|nr:hypothetical protein CGRA01v4_07129 [Colletotrichum graminicola]
MQVPPKYLTVQGLAQKAGRFLQRKQGRAHNNAAPQPKSCQDQHDTHTHTHTHTHTPWTFDSQLPGRERHGQAPMDHDSDWCLGSDENQDHVPTEPLSPLSFPFLGYRRVVRSDGRPSCHALRRRCCRHLFPRILFFSTQRNVK